MSSAEKDAYIKQLESKTEEQAQLIASLNQKIDNLTEIIIQMNKDKYGSSSEKTPKEDLSDQLYMTEVFNEVEFSVDDAVEEPAKITSSGKVRMNVHSKRELVLKNVPTRQVICEGTPQSLVCPQCGNSLKAIGTEVVRRELDYHPASLEVIEYVQTAYACPKCKHSDHPYIVKAPVPRSLLNHSLASASSVANVMYQKYVNAMPLYRQEQTWKDLGIDLSRSTLANWVIRCSEDYFTPIVDRLHKELLSRDIAHADETPVQVLKEDGKEPTSKSYMWLYRTGNDGKSPVILYDYKPSRSGENALQFLKGFSGYLHCDGYTGYNKLEDEGITRVGCLAHVRRKFVEAIPLEKSKGSAKTLAEVGRDYCNTLFDIDDSLRNLSSENRYIKRLELSKPVLDEFYNWINKANALPGSKLGKALTYAINQKQYMYNFLLDGRLAISNNAAENSIRPFTVGRKNWLFADTAKGAKASAMVYSIIETAKANGLNTYKYLEYVLREMPDSDWMRHPENLDPLMPWAEDAKRICSLNPNQEF